MLSGPPLQVDLDRYLLRRRAAERQHSLAGRCFHLRVCVREGDGEEGAGGGRGRRAQGGQRARVMRGTCHACRACMWLREGGGRPISCLQVLAGDSAVLL